jgi:hypothetical protein
MICFVCRGDGDDVMHVLVSLDAQMHQSLNMQAALIVYIPSMLHSDPISYQDIVSKMILWDIIRI